MLSIVLTLFLKKTNNVPTKKEQLKICLSGAQGDIILSVDITYAIINVHLTEGLVRSRN